MVTMDTDTTMLDTTDTITMVTVTDTMTVMVMMDTTVLLPMLEATTRDPTTTMDHTMITFTDVDTDTTLDTINPVTDKIS